MTDVTNPVGWRVSVARTGTYAKGEINRDQLLNLMAGGKELVDLEQELAKSAKNGTAQG